MKQYSMLHSLEVALPFLPDALLLLLFFKWDKQSIFSLFNSLFVAIDAVTIKAWKKHRVMICEDNFLKIEVNPGLETTQGKEETQNKKKLHVLFYDLRVGFWSPFAREKRREREEREREPGESFACLTPTVHPVSFSLVSLPSFLLSPLDESLLFNTTLYLLKLWTLFAPSIGMKGGRNWIFLWFLVYFLSDYVNQTRLLEIPRFWRDTKDI